MFSSPSCKLDTMTQKRLRKELGVVYTPSDIPETADILEPACGLGVFLTQIEQRYPEYRVSGIDISSESVDHCIKTTKRCNIMLKNFIDMDASLKYDAIIGILRMCASKISVMKREIESERNFRSREISICTCTLY